MQNMGIFMAGFPIGYIVGALLVTKIERPLYLFIGLIISFVSALGMFLPYFKFIDEKNSQERIAS
ncbi:hypothetical protein [Halalkalibacter flavus]|uniref:hypothetical protein n=1 Tax=Halalkalibacter flavus TaxID=3090668 RepID=UPI003D66A65E